MSEPLTIQSHTGPYTVVFAEDAFDQLNAAVPENAHFIIDAKVADLYQQQLSNVLAAPSVLRIEATEANKSLDKFSAYVEHLVAHKVRRGHTLIAIGGGILQDITCFLAATLLRGIPWHFYPTTLLAQADSCIGSKSSINVGEIKNVLGTFTPPRHIVISTRVLATLEKQEIQSGIGEMLKVHAIEGAESFNRIATDYEQIWSNPEVMAHYIRHSLEIKKQIIEQDEFDTNIRRIMNYGHSFGHAIESATAFQVPHGIAVTIGMDMANYVAAQFKVGDRKHYDRMHPVLATNYAGFEQIEVPMAAFVAAIAKDKKNTNTGLSVILPDADSCITQHFLPNDAAFHQVCTDYLENQRSK